MKDKVAFTLAETLITLAIIGIVAALTIPSLVVSYQKKQYVTQLKKSYNQLSNGFKTAMANDGVTRLSDTILFSNIDRHTGLGNQTIFRNELGKVFNIKEHYAANSLPTNSEYVIKYKRLSGMGVISQPPTKDYSTAILSDGTILYYEFYKKPETSDNQAEIKQKGGKMLSIIGDLQIDVNGLKAPNQWGRDMFYFYVDDFGTLFPVYGYDESLFLPTDKYYKTSKTCTPRGSGTSCTARIMEENWEMNY